MGLRVPVSWLNDYVPTSNVEELAERLTLAGLEIETIEHIGPQWEEGCFFVAEILDVTPHPNADRLSLAKVDYGQKLPMVVVSGAPNLREWEGKSIPSPLKVAFAITGATLVDAYSEEERTIQLKPSKIRGVHSEGMLCSEKELGLSDAHEGILILPEDAPVGQPLRAYLGDAVLHFDIKGGFSHLLAVLGIAREVAALTSSSFNKEVIGDIASLPHHITDQPDFVKLEIENPDLCPRYSALLIEGVKLGPAPFWMQQRLLRAGMRPISNIVDITNYVMLEMGQPLHAFDYDLLKKHDGGDLPTIMVRCAKDRETMHTLDGEERTFDSEMLLIADSTGATAIAGIMGGVETEICDETVNILLESANFEFLNNRRTAQLLKLNTEASERFGKRIDPELTLPAAFRAAQLMVEYAGGTLRPVYGDLYPKKKETLSIELDPHYVHRLLGIELAESEIIEILESLEFEVIPGEKLQVTVPSHRMDVTIAADLVEEVARVYGYNRMKGTLMDDELPEYHANVQLLCNEKVRDILTSIGINEIITYSIIDTQKEALLNQDNLVDVSQYVALKNPLTAERTHLRRSLLPGALITVQSNLRSHEQVALFEVGSTYHPQNNALLPNEQPELSIVLTGKRYRSSWMNKGDEQTIDFYDLKGAVENLLEGLHIENCEWKRGSRPAYHPGRCAEVFIEGNSWGIVGEIHPKVCQKFGLPQQSVCAAELNLSMLAKYWKEDHSITELSIYTPIYEDLAFVVEESVPASMVEALIAKNGKPLLTRIKLFDIFRGDRVGTDKKSLAYALTYQADDRTLTNQDVEPVRNKIIAQLKSELNAELRI
ncbi:MAG: phenylalanine--tRNA ligase subunit beta [SAR324 cluster bacterium]|nr:phenylalanine--tRNA ligase subunit beta [SAR324 cluster bacterium]